ncbi:MAG: hypothetical protein ACE37F_22710 [Nannocystaceae bacterium]|nr:hypothetical protein [bacterium]
MRIQISDSAPGFGPSRESYLHARIRRLVEPYAPAIDGVELSVAFDGLFHEAGLAVRFHHGSPAFFRCKSRRMVNALANLLDSVEGRLARQFPKHRPQHDEAM